MTQNSKRGFGAMDEQQKKEISRKGGESSGVGRGNQNSAGGKGLTSTDQEARERVSREAGKDSHEKRTGHEWNSEEAREAGRKGGEKSGGGHR